MLDRTIPFFNTILRCDRFAYREPVLPEGFSIVPYRKDFEKGWARLELSSGDFSSLQEAEDYFMRTYTADAEVLASRARFLLNDKGKVVGSCIAWQDDRRNQPVSSLHWLIVDKDYQGNGLGRALAVEVMNIYLKKDAFPVYIHTQPWSMKAIFLYLSLGFRLQKTDTFSHYINQYESAMNTLEKIVTKEQFALLKNLSDD